MGNSRDGEGNENTKQNEMPGRPLTPLAVTARLRLRGIEPRSQPLSLAVT